MHYCELDWLPTSRVMLQFDSYRPCDLRSVIDSAVKPFAEHCMRKYMAGLLLKRSGRLARSSPPAVGIEVVTLDVPQQPEGSNVCAFSSAVFLGKAIGALFEVSALHGERSDISAEYCSALNQLKVSVDAYEGRRRSAKHDVARLRRDYDAAVAAVAAATAAAAEEEEAAAEEAAEEEQAATKEAAGEEAAAQYEEDDFGNDHWDDMEMAGEEPAPSGEGMDEEMEEEDTPIYTLGPGPKASVPLRPGLESSSENESPSDSE